MTKRATSLKPQTWLWVSSFAFLTSVLLFIALIISSEKVESHELSLRIYYFILIPTGLSAAAFLFGAMQSYAAYTGKVWFGKLQLSGPAVLFALVVAGGMYLTETNDDTFLLTVRVHGPGGKSDLIRKGKIHLDLASERRTKKLNETGEVHFAEVPRKFLLAPVEIHPEVQGYRRIESQWPRTIPDDKVIYLELQPFATYESVRGQVIDPEGHPLPGVTLILDGGRAVATSDASGLFKLDVAADPGDVFRLSAQIDGRVGFDDNVTIPKDKPLRIKLK